MNNVRINIKGNEFIAPNLEEANITLNELIDLGHKEAAINEDDYKNNLIVKAAELSAAKTKALDGLITDSVLGIKKARVGIYYQKNADAEAGEYDDEPEEKAAIIAKHKAQIQAEKAAKSEYKHLYKKIERAYKQVLRLVNKGKYIKAKDALMVFSASGIEVTENRIDEVTI